MKIPLALPYIDSTENNNLLVLAGDIGGTKTNLGLFRSENGEMRMVTNRSFHSRQFPNFTAIIQQFLLESSTEKPDRISIGVAGPVLNNKVRTTNLAWELDAEQLAIDTGVDKVFLINDLEANAYGLAGLTDQDLVTIHEVKNRVDGNMAILAPGTGLGEAGLFWDGKQYHPFATEGGHCDFSQQTDIDRDLYNYLNNKHGHVSWEHVVSGPAIYNIYLFLRDVLKREEPHWLSVRLKEDDPSAVISTTAIQGISDICDETMKLFVGYMARECCNLVLKMKSTGGLYLGGGIPHKILKYILDDQFYKTYNTTDATQIALVQSVPIYVITNPKTALIGSAYFGAFGKN